ncbi:hypothetical protein ACU4GD_35650 [Cupriavidus basilensis]
MAIAASALDRRCSATCRQPACGWGRFSPGTLERLLHAAVHHQYVMRILVVRRPLRYVFSFFGVVDFMSILPTWLAIFVPELAYLLDVRVLRVLRVFLI